MINRELIYLVPDTMHAVPDTHISPYRSHDEFLQITILYTCMLNTTQVHTRPSHTGPLGTIHTDLISSPYILHCSSNSIYVSLTSEELSSKRFSLRKTK